MALPENLYNEKNMDFLLDTQPIGNLMFLDTMIQSGNQFMTSIYVWKYPTEVDGYWQEFLHDIPNTYVTTDIASHESGEALKKLRKAIRTQYDKILSETESYNREIATEEYQELNRLAAALRKREALIKYMCTRIWVYAESRYELDRRVADIQKLLTNNRFAGTPLAMEQEYEYQSIFLDHNTQSQLPNSRVGVDISTEFADLTFPANHVYLNDARGQFLGYSMTNGHIIFDPFEYDGVYRKQHNVLIFGDMGSGKSTLMKKMMNNLGAKGYVLRGFDKSGEYTDLIDSLDGKIIALDGTAGKLNIFQVFPTVIDETTRQVNEQASFVQHKSKLGTWYSILKPNAREEEISLFESALNELYEKHGFDSQNERTQYSTRSNEEYPTLFDMVELTNTLYRDKSLSDLKREIYERIHITLQSLLENYGYLLDGHTSINGLLTEQILFFNIDGLSNLNKEIMDAQMFNALSLFWATLLNHGKEQVRLYRKKEITFDEITRSMLFIDECHNLINIDSPRPTKFVNTMQREGRKFYIGVILATQAINSLSPEHKGNATTELITNIYNFSQYKFFFKLDSAQIPHLKRLTEYDLTEGQTDNIPLYPVGRCLLNITGGTSIEFDVEASETELLLFNGGGRSADDY